MKYNKAENKFEFEIKTCISCGGKGEGMSRIPCPNYDKKMNRKVCEHCGTTNRNHSYIDNGIVTCSNCDGKGELMETIYDSIRGEDMLEFIDSLEYIVTPVGSNWDCDNVFLACCYSPVQHFGATDYKDHRNDTVDQLKALMVESLSRGTQAIHLVDRKTNKPKTKCIMVGYNGGYTSLLV